MYEIYEHGILIQRTDYVDYQLYDDRVKSFYCSDEENGRAVLIQPETEGAESFYANIEGKEGYSWLTRTVEVVKVG